MRRWLLLFALVAAGCHSAALASDGAVGSAGDATVDVGRAIDAPVDRMLDAPCIVQVGPTCGGKLWTADFSVDPRTLDNNCDGVADFHMYGELQMPGTISNGVWAEPGAMAIPAHLLETQPADPFLTRTIVHARMRNTAAIQAGSRHGALLALDIGYDGTRFGTVFVEMRLTGDATSQTITIFEVLYGNEVIVDPMGAFDPGFHDIVLDIDPPSRKITITVDGVNRGDRYYDLTTGTVEESVAVAADGANAEFDELSVESCP